MLLLSVYFSILQVEHCRIRKTIVYCYVSMIYIIERMATLKCHTMAMNWKIIEKWIIPQSILCQTVLFSVPMCPWDHHTSETHCFHQQLEKRSNCAINVWNHLTYRKASNMKCTESKKNKCFPPIWQLSMLWPSLVQIMNCLYAPGHNLNQCWPVANMKLSQ